jgi:hypothetical protein
MKARTARPSGEPRRADGTLGLSTPRFFCADIFVRMTEHGILITALHNHLVHGSPDLYFMHFWADDSAEKVAKGLRAGLDAMKKS